MKALAVTAAAVAALVALVAPTTHRASTPATTTTTTTVAEWRDVCAVRIEWVPRGAGSVQAPTFDCHRERVSGDG